GVSHPVQGERGAVSGQVLAVGAVLLHRTPAVGHLGPGEVREIRGGVGCRRGGEGPGLVEGERVAGGVLHPGGTALDRREVGRRCGEVGAWVEGHGEAQRAVVHARGEERRGALAHERDARGADGGSGRGLAEGGGDLRSVGHSGRVGGGGGRVHRRRGGGGCRPRVACPTLFQSERVAGGVLHPGGTA